MKIEPPLYNYNFKRQLFFPPLMEFVRRREARLRPALNSIVVAFITTQMRYEDSLDRDDAVNAADADRESRQDEVGVVMAEFDKLATLTSARRDSPYVFNRADAYAETLA